MLLYVANVPASRTVIKPRAEALMRSRVLTVARDRGAPAEADAKSKA